MKLLDRELVYQGWGRFYLLKLQMADGAVVSHQMDDHGSAAVVLPYDPERKVALIARMPRCGPLFLGQDPFLIEAAAGIIEAGEAPAEAARREAMEELGVRLGEVEAIGPYFCSPSTCSEMSHLFLAPYGAPDRVAEGGGLKIEHEHIEVMETSLAELARMVDGGQLRDMKTLALILALMRRRPDLF
jgi:nudix-type nucleoside diphosphatase (YffH/AdpP family)